MKKRVTCSICVGGGETEGPPDATPDMPTFWSHLTIAEYGGAVRNFILCRDCTAGIRQRMQLLSEAHRDIRAEAGK